LADRDRELHHAQSTEQRCFPADIPGIRAGRIGVGLSTITTLVSQSLGVRRLVAGISSANAAPQRVAAGPSASYQVSLSPASTHRLACNCPQCQAARAGRSNGGEQRGTTSVDYTDRIKRSGKVSVDALLAGGGRWWHADGSDGRTPSSGARHALTYSFISDASGLNGTDANGFQALSSAQQDKVREALAYISTVADLSFSEVGSGGDIRYGANEQASSAGYARYPNEGAQVFFAKNQSSFDSDWSKGSYEWEVVLHETGHALGLKHPGNYNAGGGGTPGPYLPKGEDNRDNTIMSYHNASDMKRIVFANNMFSSSAVNPDTYQGDDIQALQYLYGASTSAQAQTYAWDPDQRLSQTIWNSNAGSSIDLSNQTLNNVVDLRAGHRSSIAIRDAYADMPFSKAEYAKLTSGGKKLTSLLGTPGYTGRDNLLIAAGSHINQATGGSGNDTFITNSEGDTVDGGDGNDRVFVSGGNATVTGGAGDDTVYLRKTARAVWNVDGGLTTATLTRTDRVTHAVTTLATVSLSGVEHVKLWNGTSLHAVA